MFLGVEIEINHHCNLSCDYCPNSKTERKETGAMSPQIFERAMRQLQELDYKGRISYHFYNEPLLNPYLETFVKTSKQLLPETKSEISTNGTLLTLEKFNQLRAAGVDKFTVTKHKDLKKIAFEATYEALNDEEKRSIKFNDHSSLIYTSRGGLVPYGRELNDNIKKRRCLIPECMLVITVKGNVLPCYEDYGQHNVMGNINEMSLKEIWNSDKYVQFRQDLWNGHREKYAVCKDCNNIKVIQ
jgi:radical SAM protein with 4Fe4S-binding SPASM domain